ncbi:hypothetical protein GCM10017600_12700 [Streptosporangium carneum]|uniref:Uncharacterized protein n=1 Tax=Streptosporangium carneum TaxID=47481 RepID=A0A9W6HYT7_9ACTN|nr:hypothetical protein GCM10017600_12700 [Streptosporangium carneum]
MGEPLLGHLVMPVQLTGDDGLKLKQQLGLTELSHTAFSLTDYGTVTYVSVGRPKPGKRDTPSARPSWGLEVSGRGHGGTETLPRCRGWNSTSG